MEVPLLSFVWWVGELGLVPCLLVCMGSASGDLTKLFVGLESDL
jgi:hypothetical protein